MAKDKSTNTPAQGPSGKLYRSSLKPLYPMAIAGYLAAIKLVYDGINGLKMYPPEGEDPFRYISGYLPIFIAILIFVGTTFLVTKNFDRRLGISDQCVLYRHRNGKTKKLLWSRISIQAPYDSNPSIFSKLRITDGENTVTIEKFFFKEDFEKIGQELKETRKKLRNRGQETETSSSLDDDELKADLGWKS